MIPQAVRCEECGRKAVVRGYGRVVYDWANANAGADTLIIRAVNLTIDCPLCGVRVQELCPNPEPASVPAGQSKGVPERRFRPRPR